MMVAKQNTSTVVPKLRFPDFRHTSAWTSQTLSDLTDVVRGGSPRPIDAFITTESDGLNWLKIGDVSKDSKYITGTEQKVLKAALSKTREIAPGDFILSNSMSFGRPYLSKIRTCIHDGWIAVTSLPDSFNRDFLYYSMMSEASQTYFENQAAGSGVRNLTVDIVKLLPVRLPSSAEQQKIADCLTSLDEVIAAQGRKVEALKAHKRGLMQRLFPREGETRPRLRFPEFRDTSEWDEMPLGDLVDLLSGYPFDGKDIVEDSSGERLMRGINITEGAVRHSAEIDRYYTGSMNGIERYRLEENDLVIGMDGSKVGKNSALIVSEDAGALLIQRVARLRAGSVALINFIFQQIHSPRFHAYVDRINTSSGIPHISAKQIREYPIHSTSDEEQQRIADCLSSLDTQIIAESNQLAALKSHKQGLMQQLFPSGSER